MRYFLVLLLIMAISSVGNAKDKVSVGDIPPSYVGKTLDSKKIELSDMKGKIVVMTFWATWCAPCMAELPVLNELQKQVSPERLQVVAINYGEIRRKVKHIMSLIPDSKILFTRDPYKSASRRYGVRGIPHMVIVDHEGKVANIHIGYGSGTEDRLVEELNVLLRAAPVVISNPVVEKEAS